MDGRGSMPMGRDPIVWCISSVHVPVMCPVCGVPYGKVARLPPGRGHRMAVATRAPATSSGAAVIFLTIIRLSGGL